MHTVTAAYLTTAFIVGGVAALHLLRHRHRRDKVSPATRTMFSMAMWMAAIFAPVQIVLGDFHGINTLEHQPAKVMAMEAISRAMTKARRCTCSASRTRTNSAWTMPSASPSCRP